MSPNNNLVHDLTGSQVARLNMSNCLVFKRPVALEDEVFVIL